MKQKIHATTIISGYRLASKEACKYIKEQLAIPVDSLGKDALISTAKTSMSSKIIGPDADFFAKMCVDAMLRVKTVNKRGKPRYPLNSVNVLKSHGKSMKESMFVAGFALNCTIVDQAMVKQVKNAKIALLDFSLQRHKMKHG
jgi:T-complex protein 1 subunit alpha